MKLHRQVIFSASLFLLFLASCKEDDPAPTKTDLLTSKPWKLTFIKILDIETAPNDCSQDDIYTYKKDQTTIQDEGLIKCNPDDVQTITKTWAFNSNETILIITSGTGGSNSLSIDEQILELTSASLKVKYNVLGIDVEQYFIH